MGNQEIVVVRNLLAGAVEVDGLVEGEAAFVGRVERERTDHTVHPLSVYALVVSCLVVEWKSSWSVSAQVAERHQRCSKRRHRAGHSTKVLHSRSGALLLGVRSSRPSYARGCM